MAHGGERAAIQAAIVTVSTSRAGGHGGDESGDRLVELAASIGAEVARREVIPDDRKLIEATLRDLADEAGCDLVLTTGGTGFTPDDVTPEATRAVIEREAPGIGEAMRLASREHTEYWMLSRGVAGIRGRTLIVNFPGNPRSIAETGEVLAGALPHALALIARRGGGH